MFIQLWSFKKRPNSTKQPSPADPNMIFLNNVNLKESTSVTNPTLLISEKIEGMTTNPALFNYVCIPQWERYYNVVEWRYCNPVWEVDLTVDVLASYKDMIGDTEAYILRSSSLYDGGIIDVKYPQKTDVIINRQNIESDIYHTTIPSGCYILGCINNQSSNRFGAVAYYALTDNQMGQVLNYLFSDSLYNDVTVPEISKGLWKSITNPFQYIVSCTWFPYLPSNFGNTITDVKVGYWSTHVNGIMVQYLVREFGFYSQSPIRHHPQSNRGEYLNHAPYTQVLLYYPPFGEIEINTDFCQYGDNNYIHGRIYLDCVTGLADLVLSVTDGYGDDADEYKIMCTKASQIGVPIQIAQLMPDIGAITGGPSFKFFKDEVQQININDIINGVKSSGASIASSMLKQTTVSSTSGANGSLLEIIEYPTIVTKHILITEENNIEFGRPLCKTMKISDLSGYIVCADADHEFTGSATEQEAINKFMVNGFYYE